MKVLLVNGSPNKEGCTYTALSEVAGKLNELGVDTEILYLGKKAIAGCIACGYCKKAGKCVVQDGVNELAARLDEFDAFVFGSPVYYAGPNGSLTAFLDRLFYSTSGDKWAGKLGASVVSCRRGGATASFDRLNKYFTINNMPIVPSQYWNIVHGFTPADVRRDEEGLQIMRTLAQNMAWLLHCIEAGKQNGIDKPVYEKRISTHFSSIER